MSTKATPRLHPAVSGAPNLFAASADSSGDSQAVGCTLKCTLASGISKDSGGHKRKTGRRISALHRHLGTQGDFGGVGGFFLKTGGGNPLQVRILCPPSKRQATQRLSAPEVGGASFLGDRLEDRLAPCAQWTVERQRRSSRPVAETICINAGRPRLLPPLPSAAPHPVAEFSREATPAACRAGTLRGRSGEGR